MYCPYEFVCELLKADIGSILPLTRLRVGTGPEPVLWESLRETAANPPARGSEASVVIRRRVVRKNVCRPSLRTRVSSCGRRNRARGEESGRGEAQQTPLVLLYNNVCDTKRRKSVQLTADVPSFERNHQQDTRAKSAIFEYSTEYPVCNTVPRKQAYLEA